MSSVDAQGVVYGASFDIPYAIGSVSIPLSPASTSSQRGEPATPADGDDAVDSSARQNTVGASSGATQRRGVTSGNISSVRRCTHHRYCYLRDGGSLEDNAFYRWLMHEQAHVSPTDSSTEGDNATSTCPSNSGSSSSTAQSPSLLYASIACVVFILPNSFPQPRRVLRHPPFIIEDDTWAEHMVEVQLFFHPHLRIPPVTLVHQALLERRGVSSSSSSSTPPPHAPSPLSSSQATHTSELSSSGEAEVRSVWVPPLLASNYGKVKEPPVATSVVVRVANVPPQNDVNEASDHLSLPHPPTWQRRTCSTAASRTAVVAEKVDTLRLYHPTEEVFRHYRTSLALSSHPVVRELQAAFGVLYRSSHPRRVAPETEVGVDNSLQAVFLYPWSLPYEGVVAEYAEQRASTSVAVLRAVLAGLRRERAVMEAACRRSLEQIAEAATTTLPQRLCEVHDRCLKLYRKE